MVNGGGGKCNTWKTSWGRLILTKTKNKNKEFDQKIKPNSNNNNPKGKKQNKKKTVLTRLIFNPIKPVLKCWFAFKSQRFSGQLCD